MKRLVQARPRLLVALAPVLLIVGLAAALAPIALLFAAPWLLGLLWLVVRSPSALDGAGDTPSSAEAALRRLAP